MTDLLPILHEIELRVELDLSLALRKAARPRNRARALKGWATRKSGQPALVRFAHPSPQAVLAHPGDGQAQ